MELVCHFPSIECEAELTTGSIYNTANDKTRCLAFGCRVILTTIPLLEVSCRDHVAVLQTNTEMINLNVLGQQ
jgi:hypothetical protein